MRDAYATLLAGAIARDEQNLQVAASLNRDRLARAKPAYGDLTGSELAEWRAENEAKIYGDFLAGGYKSLQVSDDQIVQTVETYALGSITYKFVFDMTHTDNLSANLDIVSILSRGTLQNPVKGSFQGKRQAKREFVLFDRVDRMLTNRPTIRECNRLRAEREGERLPNSAYPISGKLDLIEVVRSFITSNQSGNLIGQITDADLYKKVSETPLPAMSETMIFTTTLTGGLDPKLELSSPTSGSRVKSAILSAKAERQDVHKLILVLQLPPRSETVAEDRSQTERKEADRSVMLKAGVRELKRLSDQEQETKLLDLLEAR
jgi:hypothetical protein